jgi:heat shock protein HtpX
MEPRRPGNAIDPPTLVEVPGTLMGIMTTNNFKTVLLLGTLGVVFVGVGSLLGGQSGAIIALVFAGLMNFAMYFWSDKMALKMSKARPATELELPNVYSTIRYLTQRENMPMPTIHVIDSPQPNAFATGRNPKHAAVAVTTGILDIMSHQELEGVLAHEISHIKNRDILIATIAATIAAALAFLARMAFWGNLFGGGRRRNDNNPLMAIVGLVAMILAPLAGMIIQRAIGRAREFQADRSGAETTGSPLNLASALQKIDEASKRHVMNVNPAVSQLFIGDPMHALRSNPRGRQRQQGGAMLKWFSTHPPTQDRIDRLEKMQMGIR